MEGRKVWNQKEFEVTGTVTSALPVTPFEAEQVEKMNEAAEIIEQFPITFGSEYFIYDPEAEFWDDYSRVSAEITTLVKAFEKNIFFRRVTDCDGKIIQWSKYSFQNEKAILFVENSQIRKMNQELMDEVLALE